MPGSWFIKTAINGQQINKWIPAAPADLRTAFSLHLRNPNGLPTDISEMDSEVNFQIYPNPTQDYLYLSLDSESFGPGATISILDLAGREVKKMTVPLNEASSQKIRIDLQGISDGIYICKLNTNRSVYQQTFIKN